MFSDIFRYFKIQRIVEALLIPLKRMPNDWADSSPNWMFVSSSHLQLSHERNSCRRIRRHVLILCSTTPFPNVMGNQTEE